ncbi:MAG: DNA mismatch repair protein MutS [Acidimicrobiia bacterium]|nr:DNA mismatch repair protein MutS [Acidimicrobiia bacterium]
MTNSERLGFDPPKLPPSRAGSFDSILFESPDSDVASETVDEPDCFGDLNLDQVVESTVKGREDYHLESIFFTPLRDVATVCYRQAAAADLERAEVRDAVEGFAEAMRVARRRHDLAMGLRHRYHRERWLLESMITYSGAVVSLSAAMGRVELASPALRGLREFLTDYTASPRFSSVREEGLELADELAAVRYAVQIRGDRVTVRTYEGGDDYSLEVEKTFAKFKQGEVKDYRVEFSRLSRMNHVEAQILDLVGLLNPRLFTRLDDYCTRNREYVDPVVARFDREVQFYLAFLDYVEPLKNAGLGFCYPQVSATSKKAEVVEGFDLALAAKLGGGGGTVVGNDFHLTGRERAIVVTGPNQGGKTTFARMFGQIHYLAGLGLPIPARRARLFLPDLVFTLFEKEEQLSTLRGKLEDELVRGHRILEEATADSLVVVNEGFSSTTLDDAVFLGTRVMNRVLERDLLCVFVTFVDELASLSEAMVSMVAQVEPEDPTIRTFRIVRTPADGLAYAFAIAEKYQLTYEQLRRRVTS